MRVLYWAELFWPYLGGIEISSLHLVAALQGRGHEVTVITASGPRPLPAEEYHDGVRICRLPFNNWLRRRDLAGVRAGVEQVTQIKRATQPQVVHINMSRPSLFFHERTLGICRAPTLLTLHAPPAPQVGDGTLFGRTLDAASWVTAVSSATLLAWCRAAPSIATHASLILNSLPMPDLPAAPLPFGPPRLVCLGRLVGEKGFELAIAAFARLCARYPGLRLVIAGDGAARTDLERQAAALGVAGQVDFLGWLPSEQVPELLNTATIAVVPSRCEEGFGLVALEAAQMARPVIAAHVGGLAEVVVDGETGLLVPKEDPAALAVQIEYLLTHPEIAQAMGQAGRRRVLARFDFDRCVDAYDQLYQKLAEGTGHAKPIGEHDHSGL